MKDEIIGGINNPTPEQQEILSVYEKIKSEPQPYYLELLGKKLTILPNVFSPKYFTDSEYFAEEIPTIVRDGSFLEIGTGTGLVACHVAENGAGKVVATDINPDACRNTVINAKNRTLNIDVHQGNMYEPVYDERFDFIFWNHPFNYAEESVDNVLLKAGFDYRYENLKRFFAEGKHHLTSNGKLLLGTSDIANLGMINDFAEEYGYAKQIVSRKRIAIEYGGKGEYELLIMEFTPRS